MMISVSVVEDDTEMRNALATLIENTGDLLLCGTYSSAEQFILGFHGSKDDIVIMDIQLPANSGIEAIKQMRPKFPDTQFLMFTVFEDEDMIFDALCAGAAGYLLKNTPSAKIIEAIRDIHSGGSPMSAQIARKVVQSFRSGTDTNAIPSIITAREAEILDYLSKGYRYKEIAGILYISIETVRTHIRNIYQKLEVQSRTEALNKVYPKR
jgi:DNA-binding NarL/FixJ family response regulator